MDSPIKIYKYRAFNENSWEILSKQEIFFSSPNSFNDPKDCRIPIQYEIGTKKQMYYKNLEKLGDMYPNISRKTVKKKAVELANLTYSRRDDKIRLEDFRKSLNKIHNEVGIFSASLIDDNKLMWSHYADSHKGFCGEFDFEILVKSLEKYIFEGVIPIFKEVSYNKISPRLNPYKLNDEQLFMSLYFTKSIEWEYEKEYRIVIYEKANTSYKILKNCITTIILGSECTIENQNKMSDVLNNVPYKIILKRAVYDDLDFEMKFIEIR